MRPEKSCAAGGMVSGYSGQDSDLLRHLLDATWRLRLCVGVLRKQEEGWCRGLEGQGHQLRGPGLLGRGPAGASDGRAGWTQSGGGVQRSEHGL